MATPPPQSTLARNKAHGGAITSKSIESHLEKILPVYSYPFLLLALKGFKVLANVGKEYAIHFEQFKTSHSISVSLTISLIVKYLISYGLVAICSC